MQEGMGAEACVAFALRSTDLRSFLAGIALQEIRLLAGCSVSDLREQLAVLSVSGRPILALDLAGSTMPNLRECAISQLAHTVGELWPSAWGGEDFSGLRDDALSRAYLPIHLAALATKLPGLSQTWARSSVSALLRGREPRVAVTPDLEWRQLSLMLSPTGVTVAVQLDREQASDAFAATVEWLAGHAGVAIVVLADVPPPAVPPWTRLLYGARILAPGPAETAPRPPESSLAPVSEPPSLKMPTILAAPAVEGRPHPLSVVELRLFRCIQADAELKPLFGFNLDVAEASLLRATVDVLWRAGRVAVEIDGAEHRAAAKYRADRDRDHRLMCAGYRVLRLTNEEVMEDCGLAVEKIREVVRLAGPQRGGPKQA